MIARVSIQSLLFIDRWCTILLSILLQRVYSLLRNWYFLLNFTIQEQYSLNLFFRTAWWYTLLLWPASFSFLFILIFWFLELWLLEFSRSVWSLGLLRACVLLYEVSFLDEVDELLWISKGFLVWIGRINSQNFHNFSHFLLVDNLCCAYLFLLSLYNDYHTFDIFSK